MIKRIFETSIYLIRGVVSCFDIRVSKHPGFNGLTIHDFRWSNDFKRLSTRFATLNVTRSAVVKTLR